jgi:hypothetical protein
MPEYAWRPLGELLIERGAIDQYVLDHWLTQQKLSGMLLGELLVQNKVVSPVEVAAALAVQRGADELVGSIADKPRQLGRVLVDQGLLSESGLQRALLAQRRHGGSLGEILVRRGYVSQKQIDQALTATEDNSVPSADGGEPVEHLASERYEVFEPGAAGPMYVADAFLDATDYAFELLYDEDPDALEIVEVRNDRRRIAWSYARPVTPEPA